MYRYLEENIGATALPKDEMQRLKQAQRLHKRKTFLRVKLHRRLAFPQKKLRS